MDNTKFTKGKWEMVNTDKVESHLDIAINSDKSDCIAWVYSESDYKNINGKANALLISKAPEMLEMLQEFVMDFDNGLIEDFQIARDRFEKIIKEATELN